MTGRLAIRSLGLILRSAVRCPRVADYRHFRTMAGPNGVDISAMRKNYSDASHTFTEQHLLAKEPIANFQAWFDLACKSPSIDEPNAMSLATATKDGKPSVRIVLLKEFSAEGFTFYTNYEGRKGRELAENPFASLCFYWTNIGDGKTVWCRQVRVEGRVERVSSDASTKYFASRPRASQIGACVSRKQSEPIANRQVLEDRQIDLEETYKDESKQIPRPEYWGGFRVIPDSVEFWQGQTQRLHDRIVFRRPRPGETIDSAVTHQGADGWLYERLSP